VAVFFSGVFNPNVFFTDSGAPVVSLDGPPLGGKGDNPRKRIFKPTGLPPYREKTPVEKRITEAHEDHAEIAARLSEEFSRENAAREEKPLPPVELMSAEAIAHEIGQRLREQIRRQEEDEEETLLMMAMLL
jgi:hypothetical protein